MKKQYWSYMNQVRFAIYFMDLCADQAYRWDLYMNLVCALASSGSIAAWAVWQEYPHIWATIIAVSQIFTALKPFLPYSARIKNIEAAQKDLKCLYSKMEHDWFLAASGELTEREMNDLVQQFQNEYIEIESRSLKQDVLLRKRRMEKRAQELTNAYFKHYFDYDESGE